MILVKKFNYKPLGLGVGICGFPNKEGKVILSGNLGLKDYDIKTKLIKFLDIPIIVHNDVDMHTLGEKYYGKGKNSENFVVLGIGTGLGAGIFINNEIYTGHSGFAGEVGHIPIQDKRKCTCGLPSCAEQVFSATALINNYNDNIKKTKQIHEKGFEEVNGAYILALAESGDKPAVDALNELALNGGRICATVAMILNPEKIILSGGITTKNEKLLELIKKEYKKLVHDFVYESTIIEISDTGSHTALYGCAYAIMNKK
jgi:glucokinase